LCRFCIAHCRDDVVASCLALLAEDLGARFVSHQLETAFGRELRKTNAVYFVFFNYAGTTGVGERKNGA
jgi:hypothetical protein